MCVCVVCGRSSEFVFACVCDVMCLCLRACVRARARVCVVSLSALRIRFPVHLGGLGMSLVDAHKADTLGHN